LTKLRFPLHLEDDEGDAVTDEGLRDAAVDATATDERRLQAGIALAVFPSASGLVVSVGGFSSRNLPAGLNRLMVWNRY
jgi:hypothetical protein